MSDDSVQLTPKVDVRRAEDRFATRAGWLDSKHSFSFGPHWDPTNTHHGVLMVSNDDIVLLPVSSPGEGAGRAMRGLP